MRGEFSVYQFFTDATYERVKWLVDSDTAVKCAQRCTRTVGARFGIVERVIITDGLDFTVFEWKFGEGITFPTPEELAACRQ